MLINLEDFDGNRTAILVNEFRIANEESGYRIFYKNFSSPLGRSLPAKGTKFRYSCLMSLIHIYTATIPSGGWVGIKDFLAFSGGSSKTSDCFNCCSYSQG